MQIDRDITLFRLIPARAGNTAFTRFRKRVSTAHPRSRGEHSSLMSLNGQGRGSSPLARGTHAVIFDVEGNRRLIPARAGNTPPSSLLPFPLAAHPRSRGEHLRDLKREVLKGGSSPLARGTLYLDTSISPPCRLIPARAGNTGRFREKS